MEENNLEVLMTKFGKALIELYPNSHPSPEFNLAVLKNGKCYMSIKIICGKNK